MFLEIFERQYNGYGPAITEISAIKKQLELVERWNRCDLAAENIFIDKNRKELSNSQVQKL